MSPAAYVDNFCFALGSQKRSVEDSAVAGLTRTAADDLRDAGFRYHHVCAADETAYDLARAAVATLGDDVVAEIDAIVHATCIPLNANVGGSRRLPPGGRRPHHQRRHGGGRRRRDRRGLLQRALVAARKTWEHPAGTAAGSAASASHRFSPPASSTRSRLCERGRGARGAAPMGGVQGRRPRPRRPRRSDAADRLRLITSLQVTDLLLFIEELRAASIDPSSLQPGVFRDIDTIYATFFEPDAQGSGAP